MKKILLFGPRTWADPDVNASWDLERKIVLGVLEGLYDEGPFELIEGCAKGVDKIACQWDKEGVVHSHFPADWASFKNAAGPIRNQKMARANPDLGITFIREGTEWSRGSGHMKKLLVLQDTPVNVLWVDSEGYVRVETC